MEAQGMTSSSPFAVHHSTSKATKINDYDIDKNTIILLNLHAVHMGKAYWKHPETLTPIGF